MPRLPVLKPRQVTRILESLGFQLVRQRGSHLQYRHADGRGTTVPNHTGRDISPVLLRQIVKDVGLTVAEFLERGE
ncbi:MAG: type II toxin-antitoxin system HicA family toxin [Phycisphaerales bacterium]